MSQPANTLIATTHYALRRDIVSGLHAAGTRLRVEHLKERYGVSTGTLREALGLLVSDGLVVMKGQRGFNVSPMSLDDLTDITDTRVLLECEALRQSITHGDDEWASGVAATYYLLTSAERDLKQAADDAFERWEARNAAFHAAMLAACPSRWSLRFLDVLYRQSERYRRITLQHRDAIGRDVHGEHAALAEATLARDSDRACALLAQHIRTTLDGIRELNLPDLPQHTPREVA